MESQMLARGTLVVAAGLAIGFSMSCLLVETSHAANECMLKPNGTAPQGTHWYYHLERATQRKCWYLGAEGTRAQVRGLLATAKPQRTPSKPAAETAAQAPIELTTAAADRAADIPAPNANAAQDATTASLSTRWSGFSRSGSAVSAEPPTASMSSSYVQERAAAPAEDDMPLIWPILTPAELSQTEPVPQASISLWQLTAAFAAVLALAALITHVLLRLTAARKHIMARRSARAGFRERPIPQSRATVAQKPLRATSSRAADTEASVRQLLHALQHRRSTDHRGRLQARLAEDAPATP
jgi:hypothetical protein